MADEAREIKAKKLAAARKKLKEYQSRGMESGSLTTSSLTTSSTSVASSERSECEINIEGASTPNLMTDISHSVTSNEQVTNLSSYFNTPAKDSIIELNLSDQQQQPQQQLPQPASACIENVFMPNSIGNVELVDTTASFQLNEQFQQQQPQLNAMQLLIAEKTQLTAELNRWRNLCREKDTTLDDLRMQLNTRNQEFEDFQHNFKQQQQTTEQLRKLNAELMHKLSQANAVQEDQSAHLTELQQQLKLAQNHVNELEQKFIEKSKEYELAQLRIKQISDDGNLGKDERVESLTQNQYMYEQQIRDLQAMVQQFTQDKEQSSLQYQNYVQHLKAEITKLSERNSDLTDTCTQLQERERQLVEHISELEREIQRNLSLRQTAEENQTPKSTNLECTTTIAEVDAFKKQIATLEERLGDFDFERHEFQLKIKSQEDRLEELQKAIHEKEETLDKISEHLPEQPDQVKLLAAMESDKIAASRALGQNIKLKKQLDEMEMRFVQLTNDKAELTIELDKEIFEKRAIQTKMEEMELKLNSLDEKFQNKDEEMIRLSHENMELKQQNSILQQQTDNLQHNEVKEYNSNYSAEEAAEGTEKAHDVLGEHHHHHHQHEHDNNEHSHNHVHNYVTCNHETIDHSASPEASVEAQEEENENLSHKIHVHPATPSIATAEAIEKLQARFTYLISQVADLTDEKQRLEHLVMQLQDETETIGEYIALYQTQRRILKQREYEKAAQTRLLQEEREKLRDKVAQLNELVLKLGLLEQAAQATSAAEITEADIKAQLHAALAESVSIEPHNDGDHQHDNNVGDAALINHKLNDLQNSLPMPASNDLLIQIQNIVTEIKENATRDLPLLDTKTNNAIEICHCCEGQLKIV